MVNRVAWSIVLAIVLMCCALIASAARAQSLPNDERGSWRRTAAQGAMLARVIVSERSDVLRSDDYDHGEIDLFASVVLNNRGLLKKARGWLDVLGELAPHVTRRREPTKPRHLWTSTLVGCTEAQPSGWVSERDGDWRIYQLRWQSFCLDVRDRWIRGQFTLTSDVIAWGNLEDSQRHICGRSARNLCPVALVVGAKDRINVFFAFVGDAACSDALREAFVEEHCEGRR